MLLFLLFLRIKRLYSLFLHDNPLIIRRFGEVLASVAPERTPAGAGPGPPSALLGPGRGLWVLRARAGRGRCCPALAALAPLGGSIGAAGDELAPF